MPFLSPRLPRFTFVKRKCLRERSGYLMKLIDLLRISEHFAEADSFTPELMSNLLQNLNKVWKDRESKQV